MLALWRGPPLADFTAGAFAQAEITRLEQLRAEVAEDRIEADLALGQHARVLSKLEAIVASQPLRERPYQQLTVALYRCGRQADALAVYQKARRALVDELGIEPASHCCDLSARSCGRTRHSSPATMAIRPCRDRDSRSRLETARTSPARR